MRLIDADAMAESLEYDVELDARALDSTDLVGPEREHVQFDKDCKQNCMWYLTEQPTIPAPRWVRCEDRMPKDQSPVLVFVPPHEEYDDYYYGYVGMAYFTYSANGGFWCGTDGNLYGAMGMIHSPTHWMPLPEPPKEEE